jgi:osmotically-inducible protein OsmY
VKSTLLKGLMLGIALTSLSAGAATPDGLLTSKTKLSLWTTAGVRSTTVHVDTTDGIVTLYGKVPSTAQRALAEKTTRAIPDVREVKNLLQVVAEADEKAINANDKDLKAEASKRLGADKALKDSKITVKSVDKGLVLLSGEAKTFSDHLRAVFLADRIPGVRGVASEVKGPDVFGNDERVTFVNKPLSKPVVEAKTSSTDMRISAAVKLRLFAAAQVPSMEISVDTEDGQVTLFGIVPSQAVKNAAADEASKVAGVERIKNQLEVVASSQKAVTVSKDEDIQRDLLLAFKDIASFKGVTSTVKNGAVRLTGRVASGWDEISAVRISRLVPGVRSVDDQLKVDEATADTRPRN